MQLTITFILLALFIGAAQSQTWAGTYTADSSCSTSACCCLAGQVVLTSLTTSTYSVVSNVNGVCNGTTMFSGVAFVNGYTGWIIVTSNNTLTLSSDSRTVTVTNPSMSVCSGKGVKSGAAKEYVNTIMLLATLLTSMVMRT